MSTIKSSFMNLDKYINNAWMFYVYSIKEDANNF